MTSPISDHERGDDALGVLVVGDEVQHGVEDDADRAVEVDEAGHLVGGEDGAGLAHVGLDRGGPVLGGQQGAGVRDDDRVDVHVDDAGVRMDALRDLVDVALVGQPRAEVDVLVDPLLGDVGDGAAEEAPVRAEGLDAVRDGLDEVARELAVGCVVVLAAEHVVVHAGHVRGGRVDPPRHVLLFRHRLFDPVCRGW